MEIRLTSQKNRLQMTAGRACLVLLAFLIPFLIVALGSAALLITPFGKHSFAITDAKYYLNGQMFFARLLRGEENFLYSFNNGLGQNEWSILSWGGLAPASLLSLFATRESIPDLFTWICATNISLCGLTMYILLAGLRGPRLSHLIFSTSYALIGFNVVNCYQTLFFIGPQMLPLVILGLVRLMKERTPLLYVLSLAFCIFCNFYFGFMLCVASVIFFVTWFCLHRSETKERKVKLLRWSASSVIAGLLAAPMWLPALKAFSGGGRLDQTVLAEFNFTENMPFIQMFSKLFTGANSMNELVIGMPNIFCGILVLALVLLFFLSKRTERRKKKAAGFILCFYLLTFYIPAFTLLMHGGTHTNWFPFRYSFVFSFLLICLAMEEFEQLDEITPEETKKCGVILLVSALLIFSVSYEFISGGCVLLDFLLLLLMWAAFRFYKLRPGKAPKRVLTALLLILVCGNLYANFVVSTKKVLDWELDLEEYQNNIFISGSMIDALNEVESGFFRMEKDVSESSSIGADPYLYDYNGVSYSGPAVRMFVHKGLQKLGVNWFDMRHWYSEGVPSATDSLLGLKYLISSRDLTEEKDYTLKFGVMDDRIYQNPNALSVAILTDGGAQDLILGDDVFENLNRVWCAMTGREAPIFSEPEEVTFTLHNAVSNQSVSSTELRLNNGTENGDTEENEEENAKPSGTYIEYSFATEKSGPVYMFDTSIPSSRQGLQTPSIKFCGCFEAGETVTGEINVGQADYLTGAFFRGYCANLVFAVADNELLEEYAQLLNSRDTSFNVVHENDLTGSFNAEEGQRILFTMPWDEGWTCYIDGQKVPVDKTWDLFMSVEVPVGKHTYEMKFFPAWMNYGLVLCTAALIGLVAFMLLRKRCRVASKPVPEIVQADAADFPAEEPGSTTGLPEKEETE